MTSMFHFVVPIGGEDAVHVGQFLPNGESLFARGNGTCIVAFRSGGTNHREISRGDVIAIPHEAYALEVQLFITRQHPPLNL